MSVYVVCSAKCSPSVHEYEDEERYFALERFCGNCDAPMRKATDEEVERAYPRPQTSSWAPQEVQEGAN